MAEKKIKKTNELDEMSLDELIEKCKQMKELLANIENQYRTAAITEQSYKQTKEANTKKLNEVKKRLEEWGVKDEDVPAPAAAPLAQKPAASTSAAPAQAPATATAPSSPLPPKTAQVPPPAESPVFTPPQEAEEPAPAIETPAAPPAPSAPKPSFAQKLKQLMPSSQRSPEDPAYISQTVQLELAKFQEKFNVELERIKASIDAMKETRASSDERLHMLTEGIAELRSNVFQREAGIKEQEMKLTKLKEMVDEIEPQKISKEFSKRDKISSDVEVRLEKLEIKINDLVKTVNDINALLKSIGGLENVADVNHEVTKKYQEIREINTATERLSSKIEKAFIDLNRRLEKFNIYEARQDNISEIVNDMIRNFDALSLKFESYAEKKELTTAKEDITDIQKKIEELKKTLNRAVPFAEAQVPEEIQSLQTEREDIESLLSSIEYEHEKKQISDEEYSSIRVKNGARLKEIKKKIAEAMKKIEPPTEEKGEKNTTAGAKTSGPQLVDAMSKDMDNLKEAAKKTAEESKKKDEAAKKEAEKEKEEELEKGAKESGEDSGDDDKESESEGEEENDKSGEEGENPESEDGKENGESEDKENEEAGKEEPKADAKEKKETLVKKPSKVKSGASKTVKDVPEKIEIIDETEEEPMPEITDEHIEKAVAEELKIHQDLEPEAEEIVQAKPARMASKKPAKTVHKAATLKAKRAEHKTAPKAHETKETKGKYGQEAIATRMFLHANKIKAPEAKAAEKNVAENSQKRKAAPAKQNKIPAKKSEPNSRSSSTKKAMPAKKAAAPLPVKPANHVAVEQKIPSSINKAAVRMPMPAAQSPRKSLRSSQGLFVPAKEIESIKSVISSGAHAAQMPEKHDEMPLKNAEPVKAIKEAPVKPAKENTVAPAQPAKKSEKTEPKAAANEAENPLIAELNESLKQGLISKETYENTKKLLMMD